MDTAQTALVAQLIAPGSVSKKYRMTVIGLIAVFLIFVLTAGVFMYNPVNAGTFLSFAQTVITAVGGMVAAFSVAQAAVDYRSTASLASRSVDV